MYYIKDKNDKIVLFDEDRTKLQQTLLFMPQYLDCEIYQTLDGDTIVDYKLVTEDKATEIEKKKEEDRVNRLTMTANDLIKAVKTLGVTDEEIENFLNTHLAIKHELQFCQNVYCGIVKQFLPVEISEGVMLTDELAEHLFKAKNGEES